jgi:carboxylesterase type B
LNNNSFFFSIKGDETTQLQGNFGIFDQKLAIQWVYDNIDAFGGDSQRVCFLNRYLSFFNV